ncbi:hypothetical protein Aab01nite_82500 [Paractinoplanes abujensis]|nr:hypothetical protein Aab01nite_82500 [Actinoplanes abujensis]
MWCATTIGTPIRRCTRPSTNCKASIPPSDEPTTTPWYLPAMRISLDHARGRAERAGTDGSIYPR